MWRFSSGLEWLFSPGSKWRLSPGANNDMKLTQEDLADKLHVSVSTIHNYEKGRHEPNFSTLCEIARFFDVSTDYLLGMTNSCVHQKDLQRPITDKHTLGDLVTTICSLDSKSQEGLVLLFCKQK